MPLRNAAFLGVDGAVGLGAKLDDAEDVHFAAALEGLVVEVGDDALHGVGFLPVPVPAPLKGWVLVPSV